MVCGLEVAKAASHAGQAWQRVRVSKVLLVLKHERAMESRGGLTPSGRVRLPAEPRRDYWRCSPAAVDPDILEMTVLWNHHPGQQQLRAGAGHSRDKLLPAAEDEAEKGPGSSGAQRITSGSQKSSIELYIVTLSSQLCSGSTLMGVKKYFNLFLSYREPQCFRDFGILQTLWKF